jgi:hypothetical protein
MSIAALKNAKVIGNPQVVLLAWTMLFFHGAARSALPSAAPEVLTTTPTPTGTNTVSATPDPNGSSEVFWSLPPVRLGGSISYSKRRDSFDGGDSENSGFIGTLNASTNTFIWQPWFARLNANIGFTKSTDQSEVGGFGSSTSNVMITGRGRLSVLEQSRFPFEAHFERSDNRVSNDLAVANGYASQRYGFTQRYAKPNGSMMFGWDRSTQTSGDTGDDRQDSLVLQISHSLGSHHLQFNGDRTTNRHEMTGENANQDSLSVQHNYSAGSELSMANMANVSRSDLHLVQGESKTRLMQLSSNVFWRPDELPMTVSGGVRLYGLTGDSSITGTGEPLNTQASVINAYAGVNYEYSRFTRLNASFNASSIDSNGLRIAQTSQSVGVNHQPDDIDLGFARYSWGTSATASAQRGGDQSERGLILQISHRLSQNFKLEGGSTITVDGSQGLTASANNRTVDSTAVTDTPLPPTRQLIHSGSVSWDRYEQSGMQQVRLSISDARALDGAQDYFQLLNFQASNSMPMSGHSFWSGSLTLQMMRQGNNGTYSSVTSNEGVTTSGNGLITYQNQRLFGLRNLRFGSDLRLNIQSQQTQVSQQTQLSPQSPFSLLESRTSQEVAAWINRIDYSIGRTQIRLSASISQNTVAKSNIDPSSVVGSQDAGKRTNRSISLIVSRSFGSN